MTWENIPNHPLFREFTHFETRIFLMHFYGDGAC